MLTLLDDWVSLVLPPSAAESPEMTRALEKLLLPKRKLRVELVDEPRLDLISASARSLTLRCPVVVTGGGWECRDAAELRKESRLPDSLCASSWTDVDVWRKAWRLSKMGPDELKMGGLWCNVPWVWTDWLLPFLIPLKENRTGLDLLCVEWDLGELRWAYCLHSQPWELEESCVLAVAWKLNGSPRWTRGISVREEPQTFLVDPGMSLW